MGTNEASAVLLHCRYSKALSKYARSIKSPIDSTAHWHAVVF